MKTKIKYLILVTIVIFVTACVTNEISAPNIQIRLTDAPAEYQEVNVDIQDIQVNHSEIGNEWTSIDLVNKGTYDLLKLSNGTDTLIGVYSLNSGLISQIRLVLGENNTIKVNDSIYNLTVPSGQESGLKINLDTLESKSQLILDFDANKSVVLTGNNEYLLKPVITIINRVRN